MKIPWHVDSMFDFGILEVQEVFSQVEYQTRRTTNNMTTVFCGWLIEMRVPRPQGVEYATVFFPVTEPYVQGHSPVPFFARGEA
jgi:hypothetical protein